MTPEEIKKVIQEKVIGKFVPEHDALGHKYRNINSNEVKKSVTTIIGSVISKPHLVKWQIRTALEWILIDDRLERLRNEHWKEEMMQGAMLAPFDIRDEHGGVGTLAHDTASRFVNEWLSTGIMPENIVSFAPQNCDPRAIAAMRAIEAWFKEKKNIPICSEIIVGNKYSAGSIDLICQDENGDLILQDFKSSNSIDQISYSLQVAAYCRMFEEMSGLKIKYCKILHISKDYNKFTVYKVKNISSAYKAFKQIVETYNWINERKDKIVKDVKRIKI